MKPMNWHAYPREGGGFLVTDLDSLPRCTLKKMSSDDGRWVFDETKAHVGKEYIYSPASRRVAQIEHLPTNTSRQCEIVMVYDSRGWFSMMPVECLQFPS